MVAMAVPDAQRFRHARKELGPFRPALTADFQVRTPIFAAFRFLGLAAERMRNPLHPVANPQYRNVQRQHFRIALRPIRALNRPCPAPQNDSSRLALANSFEGRPASGTTRE